MTDTNYPKPVYRKLKGYAFDPSFSATLSKRQSNQVLYKVAWEPLQPGPIGEYIAVLDYDPANRNFYNPIDMDDPFVLADHGMDPAEGDPRFHQQQVYAVIMSVIKQFEKAIGRKIIWSKITALKSSDESETSLYKHEFIKQLWVYPHAMLQQNAYYSPGKNALLFGYFRASNNWNGNNIPGATIFTCLSPDIVSHEVTHAILHSILPYLTKSTNLDMLAFHEGFSDIIALLQRFTFKTVVEDQIKNSRGDLLSPENLLGDLAIQFGQAVSGNRRALRSFLVKKDESGNVQNVVADPSLYNTLTEAHSRGGLLVAAIFDAFVRLYKYKVADLLRLASNGSGILAQGEIDPDLVKRLSAEACAISDKLMMICIRALDYCPPCDLNFGDYLRALVTADLEYNPDDEEGVRFAVMEAFRSWGIIPIDATSFSAGALKWENPKILYKNDLKLNSISQIIKNAFDPAYHSNPSLSQSDQSFSVIIGIMERILRENDRETIFNESQKLAEMIHQRLSDETLLTDHAEELLGMKFSEHIFTKIEDDLAGNPMKISLRAEARKKFQVYKCRPMILADSHTGNTRKVMIIMLLQKIYIDLKGSKYEGFFNSTKPARFKDKYAFRGGSTIIIDMATYEISYIISKSVFSNDRLFRQLDYALEHGESDENNALMMQGKEPFAALHFH